MITDLDSCSQMSDGHCPAHNQQAKECRRQAVTEYDQLRLQLEEMREVVDAACAYESILGFDDLNSAYQNRREVTDAFVKAVGAYKTRLPQKPKDERPRVTTCEHKDSREVFVDWDPNLNRQCTTCLLIFTQKRKHDKYCEKEGEHEGELC